MLAYKTRGFNGYGVAYSPFYDNKLAVATAANFGLVGNGRLYVLNIGDDGTIREEAMFDTQDGLFDVAWSELHENQVATSSGDGTVSIFDTALRQFPIQKYAEHKREVFSVNWGLVDKSIFCSSSWDGSVKIWTPQRAGSVMTLEVPKDLSVQVAPGRTAPIPMSHNAGKQPTVANPVADCVYQASFSPHDAATLISCNSSSHLQIWDVRSPKPLQIDFICHNGLEALSCDWNKYRPTVVATAGVDKTIKVWDLRFVGRGPPINDLVGHEFAVRSVKWSPHSGDRLLSCSYDMSARVWSDKTDENGRFMKRLRHADSVQNVFDRHTEFVIGGDWSMWGQPGWCATTGWDEMVYVWNSNVRF